MNNSFAIFIVFFSASVFAASDNGTQIVTSYKAGSSFKEIVESGKDVWCEPGKKWSVTWSANKEVKLPRTLYASGTFSENMLLIYKSFIEDYDKSESYFKDNQFILDNYPFLNLVLKIGNCTFSVEEKSY